jgi:hypothetical protein
MGVLKYGLGFGGQPSDEYLTEQNNTKTHEAALTENQIKLVYNALDEIDVLNGRHTPQHIKDLLVDEALNGKVEDKVFDILTDLLREDISKDDAIDKILKLLTIKQIV